MSAPRASRAPHPAYGWPTVQWEGLTARLSGGGYGLILRSEGKCHRFFLSDREAAMLRDSLVEMAQPATFCQPAAANRPAPRSPTRNVPADVRRSPTRTVIANILRRIWPRKESGA